MLSSGAFETSATESYRMTSIVPILEWEKGRRACARFPQLGQSLSFPASSMGEAPSSPFAPLSPGNLLIRDGVSIVFLQKCSGYTQELSCLLVFCSPVDQGPVPPLNLTLLPNNQAGHLL